MVTTTKHRRFYGLIFLAVAVLAINIPGMIIGGFSYIFKDYDDVKKEYETSKNELNIVCEYLESIDSSNIFIQKSTGDGMMSNNGLDVPIDDTTAARAIEQLQERGYSVIAKSGSTIHFQIWSNLDNGMGLAYTTDGNEPNLQFLTDYSVIVGNWYYYEENYNLWRQQHGFE